MKKNKITEIDGRGTFLDPHTLEVAGYDGESRRRSASTLHHRDRRHPRLLPGTALSARVVTYEEQILADDLPRSIVIAGAGAIGVEFAYVLHNYGVKVTIVEFLDRMVPLEDAEVSKPSSPSSTASWASTSSPPPASSRSTSPARRSASRSPARTAQQSPGGRQGAAGDRLRARTSTGYGLENTGVQLTERGAIDVDGRCRTNVPHILRHRRRHREADARARRRGDGRVAAETIADAETMELDYAMIPRATYCQPQIASFGYTEAQAREKGHDVKVAKFPFTANGKARPRRHHRLREADQRREVRRTPRRPPHRPRRHRAAARADPGPAVGPHRPRGRPQRARPPDPGRGGEGSRTHDHGLAGHMINAR
jgi:dihydrolipoamide dehydrogenase